MKILVYFGTYIWPFGTIYVWPFGIIYGNLVCFMVVWYIFPAWTMTNLTTGTDGLIQFLPRLV
jgi:hypothetical protein